MKRIIFLTAVILHLFSCRFPWMDEKEETGDNTGTLSLTLNTIFSDETRNSELSDTLLPSSDSYPEPNKTGVIFISTPDGKPHNTVYNTKNIVLGEGKWTILVKRYQDSTLVQQSKETEILIEKGTNTYNIDVFPSIEGKGTLELNLQWRERDYKENPATLIFRTIAEDGTSRDVNYQVENRQTFIVKQDLASGFYRSFIVLKNSNGDNLAYVARAIHIYDLAHTAGSIQFDDSLLNSSPLPPVDFTGILDDSGIELNWKDSADTEENYILRRRLSGTSVYDREWTLAANTIQYKDVDILPGYQYEYRLVSSNRFGESAQDISPLIGISSGNEIFVSKSNGFANTATGANGLPLKPFSSIQAAIDAWPNGVEGTVVIAGGYYPESLLIEKPLTLVGGYENSFSSRVYLSPEQRETANEPDYAVLVESEGFDYGLGVYATITYRNAGSQAIEGIGVRNNHNSTNTTACLSVNNSELYISHSSFFGAGSDVASYTLYIKDAHKLILDNNLIYGASGTSGSPSMAFMVYMDNSDNTDIFSNIIKETNSVPNVYALYLNESSDAAIANNFIDTSQATGLARGVEVYNCQNIDFVNNIVTSGSSASDSIGVLYEASNSSFSYFGSNNIYECGTALVKENISAADISAVMMRERFNARNFSFIPALDTYGRLSADDAWIAYNGINLEFEADDADGNPRTDSGKFGWSLGPFEYDATSTIGSEGIGSLTTSPSGSISPAVTSGTYNYTVSGLPANTYSLDFNPSAFNFNAYMEYSLDGGDFYECIGAINNNMTLPDYSSELIIRVFGDDTIDYDDYSFIILKSGDLELSIVLNWPTDQTVNLSSGVPTEISSGDPLSVTINDSYISYEWYLNNAHISSEPSVSVNTAGSPLASGVYILSCIVDTGEYYFTKTVEFAVSDL